MSKSALSAAIAVAAAVMAAPAPALAQPSGTPDQAKRTISPYIYMIDGSGNKVLVSTQIWRNDQKYDDRAFHRFLDVVAALEKKGFGQSEKATIDDWDKPVPYARCYLYLEDVQAGRKLKNAQTTGARVWCSGSGISEQEINPSDNPKHVDLALAKFDSMLDLARKNLKK